MAGDGGRPGSRRRLTTALPRRGGDERAAGARRHDHRRPALRRARSRRCSPWPPAAAPFAITGFRVSIAANVRQRRTENALLAALGVAQRSAAAQLFPEKLLLSVPSAALGLLLGTVVARLLAPADTPTTAAQPRSRRPSRSSTSRRRCRSRSPSPASRPRGRPCRFRRPDPAAELRAAEAA